MAVTNSARLGLPRWSSGSDPHPNRAGWDAQQALLDKVVAVDVQVDTYANRPGSPVDRCLMWVVDEATFYRWSGTAWQKVAPLGGVTPKAVLVGGNPAEGTSVNAARADHVHAIPIATASAAGAQTAADKAAMDAATDAATAGTLVKRNSSGGASFAQLAVSKMATAATDVANKTYADSASSTALQAAKNYSDAALTPVSALANAALPVGVYTGDANLCVTPGVYKLGQAATLALNFPTTSNGTLTVMPTKQSGGVVQTYLTDDGAVWVRGYTGSTWRSWVNVAKDYVDGKITSTAATDVAVAGTSAAGSSSNLARVDHSHALPLSSATVDGAMSKADKVKLDSASPTGVELNSLVSRGSDGKIVTGGYEIFQPSGGNLKVATTNDLNARVNYGKIDGMTNLTGVSLDGLKTSQAGVAGGYSTGMPIAPGTAPGDVAGIKNPTWFVEVQALNLNYVRQRITTLMCEPTWLENFTWERVWQPANSAWTPWTYVSGDSPLTSMVAGDHSTTWTYANTSTTKPYYTDSAENIPAWRVADGTCIISGLMTTTSSGLAGDSPSNATWLLSIYGDGLGARILKPLRDMEVNTLCTGSGSGNTYTIISKNMDTGNADFSAYKYGPSAPGTKPYLRFTVQYPIPNLDTYTGDYVANS